MTGKGWVVSRGYEVINIYMINSYNLHSFDLVKVFGFNRYLK